MASSSPCVPFACPVGGCVRGVRRPAAVQGLMGRRFTSWWRGGEACARSAIMPGTSRTQCVPGAPQARLIPALTLLLLLAASGLCQPQGPRGAAAVRTLTASNWTALQEGEWMLTFFAPWCPACQQIHAQWENLGEKSILLDIYVGKVDVTQEPGLSGRFFVTTLPTIFHAKDGVFRRYHGSRMLEDLQSFISEEKWKLVEPVPGWKSPTSILMSGMAGLFHLSGWIRQIHNYITGPLEIPVWGSYVIFIVATLLIGLILGLILVLLADCCCPSKAKYEVIRAEEADENLDVPDEVLKDPSEEDKEPSDNEEDSEGDDDDEDDDNDDEEEGSDDAKDSEVDSAEEEEEESGTEEEQPTPTTEKPSTPEPESALRQRKTESAVNNEE